MGRLLSLRDARERRDAREAEARRLAWNAERERQRADRHRSLDDILGPPPSGSSAA